MQMLDELQVLQILMSSNVLSTLEEKKMYFYVIKQCYDFYGYVKSALLCHKSMQFIVLFNILL